MSGQQLYTESFSPNILIPGQVQALTFNRPLSQYQLINNFLPTSFTNSHSLFEFINVNDSGYRFHQSTSNSAHRGDFILEQFNNGTIPGTPLFSIKESTGDFVFSPQSSGALQLNNGISAIPLQFFNASGTHYAAFKAGNLSSNITWILPTTDSTGTQAFVSNGSGVISFSSFADNLAKYIIQTADSNLPNAQVLASLSTGIVKNTTTTGVLSIATPGVDYYAPGYPTIIKDDFNLNGDPFFSTGNTSLGTLALNSLVLNSSSNTYNVAFGSEALYHFTTGAQNTGIGQSSLFALVSGSSNTAIGFYNFASLTSGNNNCALGDEAFSSLTTGDDNIGIGKYVGLSLSSGNRNCIMGTNAFWSATSSCNDNTFIGCNSAQNQTLYNSCVFIGKGSDASANNLTNAIAIGVNAAVGASNTCVIGTSGTAMNLIINGVGGSGTGTINAIWNGSIIDLPHGGTNANLTASNGGIVYSTASALAILPAASIAHLPLFSGGSGAPSWSNTTYPNTILAGQLLYGSGLNAISGLTSAPNGVLITDSGGIPSISSTLPSGVQTNITAVGTLTSGTWNAGIIPLAYGGTNANLTASAGAIPYSTASAFALLAPTTSNKVFMSGTGTVPAWSSATYPVSTTINQILYSSADNTITGLATANSSVLVTDSGGIPSISSILPSSVQANITGVGTLTSGTWHANIIPMQYGGTGANLTPSAGAIPYSTSGALNLLAPTTANKVFMSGTGTVPTWSTATYPLSTTINQILYSSAANTITGLLTANNSTLMTNSLGVPSFQTTSSNFVTSITGTTNQITSSASTGAVTLSLPSSVTISTSLTSGNLGLTGNTLQSVNTNGNINITPNGTGITIFSNNVGFGTSPSYAGDFNGTIRGKRFLGNGNAPSFTVAAGAGTGATASIAGSEIAGVFTLNTGTSPSGGLVVTFTLSSAMPNTNYSVIFMPATADATIVTLFNASSSQGNYINKISTTQFSLNIGATVSASFTYQWNYLIIGTT